VVHIKARLAQQQVERGRGLEIPAGLALRPAVFHFHPLLLEEAGLLRQV